MWMWSDLQEAFHYYQKQDRKELEGFGWHLLFLIDEFMQYLHSHTCSVSSDIKPASLSPH